MPSIVGAWLAKILKGWKKVVFRNETCILMDSVWLTKIPGCLYSDDKYAMHQNTSILDYNTLSRAKIGKQRPKITLWVKNLYREV